MNQTPQPISNHRLNHRRKILGKPKLSCYRGSLWLGRNLAMRLVNASEGGLAMIVLEAMARGQVVTLTVEAVSHPRPLKLSGKIAWCQPLPDGVFQVGIELDKRLAGNDLMRLT